MSEPTKKDIDLIRTKLTTLLDWSGVDDTSPEDTEIVRSTCDTILYADIMDMLSALRTIEECLVQKRLLK